MSRKQRLTTTRVSESLAGTLVLCNSAVLINLVKYTDMKTPSGRHLYQKNITALDMHADNFLFGIEPLNLKFFMCYYLICTLTFRELVSW